MAEALSKQKEISNKVEILKKLKDSDVFELRVQRKQVTENIDDIAARVPKLNAAQVTDEYDHYARQLRLIQCAIQKGNWVHEIEVDDYVFQPYHVPKQLDNNKPAA